MQRASRNPKRKRLDSDEALPALQSVWLIFPLHFAAAALQTSSEVPPFPHSSQKKSSKAKKKERHDEGASSTTVLSKQN